MDLKELSRKGVEGRVIGQEKRHRLGAMNNEDIAEAAGLSISSLYRKLDALGVNKSSLKTLTLTQLVDLVLILRGNATSTEEPPTVYKSEFWDKVRTPISKPKPLKSNTINKDECW